MYQIDNPTAAATQPASTTQGTPGFFTDGNAAGGIPATVVPAEWLNSVQMELINVLQTAGIAPTKNLFNQLTAAIQKLASGRLVGVQIFDTVGTFEYNPTAGATHGIVDVIGPGAGGGYGATSNIGSGGGGGGLARAFLNALTQESVVVGAGGVGATSSVAATNGGTSSFGASISASGGHAGASNSNAAGSPGIGSGGNINLSGSSGAGGIIVSAAGLFLGGFGGVTPGYSATAGYIQTGNGFPANGPGGGGGGGSNNGNGGDGYQGKVVVWEFA